MTCGWSCAPTGRSCTSRMPFLAGKLPDGKEWVSLDIEALAKQQGDAAARRR